MPLPRLGKRRSKRARRALMSKVMHELKHSKTKRSRRQMIAIGLSQSGLGRKRKRARKK